MASYRADALLDRGGMGEVWRCFDLTEERHVAIKTVLGAHLADAWRLFQAEVVTSSPAPRHATCAKSVFPSAPEHRAAEH